MKIEVSEEWINRSRTEPADITIGFVREATEDLINYDIFPEMGHFRRCWIVDDLSKLYDAQEWCLSMIKKDMEFFEESKKTELPEMIVRCVIAEPRMAIGKDDNLFTWIRGWVQATPTKTAYEKFLATGRRLDNE